MDPLINKWVNQNRAKHRDGNSTTNQLTSSPRSRPLPSGIPQWIKRDMEFVSEDDAVAPEPMGLLNERRPSLRKRKAFDDAKVEVVKSSRPKLNSTECSDMCMHDDMHVQLWVVSLMTFQGLIPLNIGQQFWYGAGDVNDDKHTSVSGVHVVLVCLFWMFFSSVDLAQGTSKESGPHESLLSHSNSGSPSIPEFLQIQVTSSPLLLAVGQWASSHHCIRPPNEISWPVGCLTRCPHIGFRSTHFSRSYNGLLHKYSQ